MKVIQYKVKAAENLLLDMRIFCPDDQTVEANLPIALQDAYNGQYTVEEI